MKKALGRGLEALIPETITVREKEVIELDIGRIRPGRYQPRLDFDKEKQEELLQSIKEKGVVQPVIVRPIDGEFELIAGERRLRAARELGMERIPALVKEVNDEQALELAIIENVQRENLNPIEEACAYRKLGEEFSLSQEDVARRVGKSRASVANAIRLLKLPGEMRDDIAAGRMSAGHGKVLLMLDEVQAQKRLRDAIVSRGMSVRDAERHVERVKAVPAHRRRLGLHKAPELLKIEESLRSALGTQVKILPKKQKGKIEIEYYSQDDLERIVEIIVGEIET